MFLQIFRLLNDQGIKSFAHNSRHIGGQKMFPVAVFPLGLYLLLTLFSGASLLLFFWHLFTKWKLATNSKKHFRFPPGPTPWPFIGNCAQVCQLLYKISNFYSSLIYATHIVLFYAGKNNSDQFTQAHSKVAFHWKTCNFSVFLPTRQIVLAGAKEQNELLTNLKYGKINLCACGVQLIYQFKRIFLQTGQLSRSFTAFSAITSRMEMVCSRCFY